MTTLTRGALLSLVLVVAACSAPISTDAPPQASAPATPVSPTTPDVTTKPASSPPPEVSAEPAADPLLAYELVDVRSGETFTLAELAAEKPVVVETMAIWCSTCRAQQREVVEAHGMADFHSVGIDVDPNERAEDLADYAVREGFDWRFAMADASVVQLLTERYGFGVTNPPSTPTFIVTADGGIRALEFGHVRSADELVAELAAG
jgi:thiol-disulfide isomerase/thioredoxin